MAERLKCMVSKLIKLFYQLCGVIDVATISAANFLISFFIIRELGPKDYAVYMNFFSGLMLISTLQNAFFHTTLSVKYAKISEYEIKIRKSNALCVFANIIHMALIVPAFFLVKYFEFENSLFFLVYCSFFLYLSRDLYRVYNYVFELRGTIVLSAIVSLFTTMLGLLYLFFNESDVTLNYIYLVSIISGVISIVIITYKLKFRLPTISEMKVSYYDLWSVGRWSSVGSLATWAQNNSYTYLATLIIGVEATAVLAIARLIVMPINLVASGIYMSEKPRWAKLYKNDKNTLKNVSVKIILSMFLFITVYSILVLSDFNYIEMIFETKVRFDLLCCWLSVCMVQVFKFSNSNILNVAEEFKYLAVMGVIVSTLGVAASTILGTYYGAIGIIVGYLIGELLHFCCSQYKIISKRLFYAN